MGRVSYLTLFVLGDGCIFVWKLASELSDLLRTKLASVAPTSATLPTTTTTTSSSSSSISNLPKKAQVASTKGKLNNASQASSEKENVSPVTETKPGMSKSLHEFFSAGGLPSWAKKALWKSTQSPNASDVSVYHFTTAEVEDEILFDRSNYLSKNNKTLLENQIKGTRTLLVVRIRFPNLFHQGKWRSKCPACSTAEGSMRLSTTTTSASPFTINISDLTNRRLSIGESSITPASAGPAQEEDTTAVVFLEEPTTSDDKPTTVTVVQNIQSENEPNSRTFKNSDVIPAVEEQFVDPAQLEQSWAVFKGEPLDRLLTVRHIPHPNSLVRH